MKAFILSYDSKQISEKNFLQYLDTRPEILNWFSIIPNTVFIVSNRSAHSLVNVFQKNYPNVFLIISEFDTLKDNGLLSDEAWDFLNNPKPAG
jgi:hypothetical protein